MPWFVAGGQPQWVNDPMSMFGATIGQGVSGARPSWMPNEADLAAKNEAYAAEQRRQWDAEHAQRQQQLDQQYEIAKRNARSSEEDREIDRWYRGESLKLERERMAQNDRQFDASMAQRQHEFGATHGLNQARLGADVMGTLASLRGPASHYQASEYARGMSQMPETATFLSALQNNTRLPGFGAQGGLPEPETGATLMAKLAGGTGLQNSAPSEGATLAQIGNIAARGAHQLGGGALERLTGTEQQLFTSGLDALGIDTPTFLQQYARSRIRNNLANASRA